MEKRRYQYSQTEKTLSSLETELTGKHIDVGAVRNGKYMSGNFATSFTTIQFGATQRIHGKTFVRIDGYTEQAGIRLQKIRLIHQRTVPKSALNPPCSFTHVN